LALSTSSNIPIIIAILSGKLEKTPAIAEATLIPQVSVVVILFILNHS
jgi:hypothetical protein